MNRTMVIAGITGVVSAAAGAAAGYLVAMKRARAEYSEFVIEELERAEKIFMRKYKVGDYDNPVNLLNESQRREYDTAQRIIKELRYDGTGEPTSVKEFFTGEQPLVEANEEIIVDNEPMVYQYEADRDYPSYTDWLAENPRSDKHPYIISTAEFMDPRIISMNVEMWDSATLTYFEEDGTLLDEQDGIIDDIDRMVGLDNLTRFGMFSDSKNTLYVANEYMGTLFEIILTKGSAAEHFGIKDEPQPRSRKKSRGADG